MAGRAGWGKHRIDRFAIGVLVFQLGCGSAVSRVESEPTTRLDYEVRSSEELDQLSVAVCFGGEPPGSLIPGLAAAAPALVLARGPRGPLEIEPGSVILLHGLRAGECIEYRVELSALPQLLWARYRAGHHFVGAPSLWLWRPAFLPARLDARIRFSLVTPFEALVPWPRIGNDYRLPPSAFRLSSFVALGRMEREDLAVAGATIRVGLLDGTDVLPATRRAWLTQAALAVAAIGGEFPTDPLSVVVMPASSRSNEPVRFGLVRRGGGFSVLLLLSNQAQPDELIANWVAIHEFIHLTLPRMPQRDAWFYEGLATYYQEVLRVRAGLKDEREAWASLLDGFERGRRINTGRMLARESLDMRITSAYARVYWAGAFYALQVDESLRRNHQTTLDAVLTRGRVRWDHSEDFFSGSDVVAQLDEVANTDLFGRLYVEFSAATDFPDTSLLLRQFGVRWDGQTVTLMDDAPRADIRRAIMQGVPSPPHGSVD